MILVDANIVLYAEDRLSLHHGKASANLVSDAHLAALAVEHDCAVASADADFARFPRVKWRNPLRD